MEAIAYAVIAGIAFWIGRITAPKTDETMPKRDKRTGRFVKAGAR